MGAQLANSLPRAPGVGNDGVHLFALSPFINLRQARLLPLAKPKCQSSAPVVRGRAVLWDRVDEITLVIEPGYRLVGLACGATIGLTLAIALKKPSALRCCGL